MSNTRAAEQGSDNTQVYCLLTDNASELIRRIHNQHLLATGERLTADQVIELVLRAYKP